MPAGREITAGAVLPHRNIIAFVGEYLDVEGAGDDKRAILRYSLMVMDGETMELAGSWHKWKD